MKEEVINHAENIKKFSTGELQGIFDGKQENVIPIVARIWAQDDGEKESGLEYLKIAVDESGLVFPTDSDIEDYLWKNSQEYRVKKLIEMFGDSQDALSSAVVTAAETQNKEERDSKFDDLRIVAERSGLTFPSDIYIVEKRANWDAQEL